MSARHAEMHVRPHQTVPEQRPVTVSQGLRQTAEVLLPRARHLVHEVLTVHEACDDVRHDSWRVLACDAWHARIVGRTRCWVPTSCSSSVRPQPWRMIRTGRAVLRWARDRPRRPWGYRGMRAAQHDASCSESRGVALPAPRAPWPCRISARGRDAACGRSRGRGRGDRPGAAPWRRLTPKRIGSVVLDQRHQGVRVQLGHLAGVLHELLR